MEKQKTRIGLLPSVISGTLGDASQAKVFPPYFKLAIPPVVDVVTALGFDPRSYAIMIAVYMALDGMGTACNLTGDGAIALLVDRFRGRPANAEGVGLPVHEAQDPADGRVAR